MHVYMMLQILLRTDGTVFSVGAPAGVLKGIILGLECDKSELMPRRNFTSNEKHDGHNNWLGPCSVSSVMAHNGVMKPTYIV